MMIETRHWLHQGSSAAQVKQVILKIIQNQDLDGFVTRPTHSQPQEF